MDWLHTLRALDASLFRWINLDLANPVFDQVMPFLSGNAFFLPAAVVVVALVLWRGGRRGFVGLLFLALAIGVADGWVVSNLKEAFARPRPFLTLEDARCLVGRGSSGSMPSAHAANWFAAVMVCSVFFRRALWVVVPLAVLVSFSRVYNGVHYPSDVLAGGVFGAGAAAAVMLLVDWAWSALGRRVFPLWWEKLPSLLAVPAPAKGGADEEFEDEPMRPPPGFRKGDPDYRPPGATIDQHWVRLGWVFLAVLLGLRLLYIGSDTIELSEDEAYQWTWSKHLDLSYYSKPPLIAYTQFLGTTLWGDTEFGVRFFSPIIATILGWLLLRFFAREVNARAGFFLLLISAATPMLAAGSVLMTIDPLNVLFWTAAMVAGWRASQDNSKLLDWVWVGVWMGLGFLSKYTQLFQLLCWTVFFLLWPPARKQLRRPGPYVALLLNFAAAIPVLIWNARHNWVTVSHVADNAGAGKPWEPLNSLRFPAEFLGAELGLLNPVFFVAALWAVLAFWKRQRRDPRLVFLFSMGVPVFACYLILSFRSRVFPNWIAPAVVPLFALMVIYWDTRWRLGRSAVKGWLIAGLAVGVPLVIVLHDTDLVGKFTKRPLPVKLDPLHRVRGWEKTARMVSEVRDEVLAEGRPVFVIAHHYGLTGELSFYMPEAREAVQQSPLVYYVTSPTPRNQYFFWPGYTGRRGETAIFVRDLDPTNPKPKPPPAILVEQFESVTELGIRNVMYRKNTVLRPLQFYVCRGLK